MAWTDWLPHGFLLVVVIIVAVFILKSLIKFAIIIGAIGLVIYLLWGLDVMSRFRGGLVPDLA